MSYTKNWHIRCDSCGRFCIPYDEETPFGCDDYDNPEPHEPYHYCEKCAKNLEEYYMNEFREYRENVIGSWQKSNAEIKAAEKYGYVWLYKGVGIYNTKDYQPPHQYITKEEYERLTNLEKCN